MKDDSLVVEISQPGIDVLTATPEQMLFSTELDGITLLEKGNGYIPDASDLVIPHSYGGRPLVTFQPALFFNVGAVEDHFPAFAWAPTPNLFMRVIGLVSSTDIRFRRLQNITGTVAFVSWQVWSKEVV